MGLRGYSMPDEIYFLCLLHNVGATTADRSLTLDEITRWTVMDPQRVRENLEKLINTDYIQKTFRDGSERYHVTINGIRKVLSMYS
jgi:DNA-binding transcriptional regulator GbsR (MarR family)